MILLTADASFVLVFQLILRIVGAIVCANRAKELNRDPAGWGIFGFLLPVIAMIWVYCMKPKGNYNQPKPTGQSGQGYQGGYDGGHNNPGTGYQGGYDGGHNSHGTAYNAPGNEPTVDYKEGDLYK